MLVFWTPTDTHEVDEIQSLGFNLPVNSHAFLSGGLPGIFEWENRSEMLTNTGT